MDNLLSNELRVTIAGSGGQGIVLVGNIMARACVIEDKNVVGMVAYGVEMRGGTAYATVIISDDEIGSPFVEVPDIAMVLNQPSLDRFEQDIAPGGMILLNTSMTVRPLIRQDLFSIEVPATGIAHDLGNVKTANIVALGAFIRHSACLKMESIEQSIEDLFASKNPKMAPINIKALHAGAEQGRLIAPAQIRS